MRRTRVLDQGRPPAKLSVPRDPMFLQLVHALGIRRMFTTSEREKRGPLVTMLPSSRMETSSSMMPRNPSGDFLSRGRSSGSILRTTNVHSSIIDRYCNEICDTEETKFKETIDYKLFECTKFTGVSFLVEKEKEMIIDFKKLPSIFVIKFIHTVLLLYTILCDFFIF